MWPVGLVGGMKYERPVVEGGKVGAFYVLIYQLFNSVLLHFSKSMNLLAKSHTAKVISIVCDSRMSFVSLI